MTSLTYLIPAALLLGGLGLAGFLWALRHDQFDDLDGAAHRILYDDEVRFADPSGEPNLSAGPGAREYPSSRAYRAPWRARSAHEADTTAACRRKETNN